MIVVMKQATAYQIVVMTINDSNDINQSSNNIGNNDG